MTTTPEPSLGEAFASVSADLRWLASHTLALARLELNTGVSTLVWSAAGVLVACLIALAGLAVLVSALVLIAIVLGLPAWVAALLVGSLLTVAGAGGASTSSATCATLS